MQMKNGQPAFLQVIAQVRQEVELWPAWMKHATSVVDYAMPEMAIRDGAPAPREVSVSSCPAERPCVCD